MATGEVDFSELHPRLLYDRFGQFPPTGDLYDDGWRDPNVPYSKDVEPYETRRDLFKAVFNAILNDEDGVISLKDDRPAMKSLNLNVTKIKKILFRMHPLLKRVIKSGIGLEFQYLDSRIAEQVMLKLVDQNIPCLPVHDSFIVPRHQSGELRKAMEQAYIDIVGIPSKLKPLEQYRSGFLLPFKPDGAVDNAALFKMHDESLHNAYVKSWRKRIGSTAVP